MEDCVVGLGLEFIWAGQSSWRLAVAFGKTVL